MLTMELVASWSLFLELVTRLFLFVKLLIFLFLKLSNWFSPCIINFVHGTNWVQIFLLGACCLLIFVCGALYLLIFLRETCCLLIFLFKKLMTRSWRDIYTPPKSNLTYYKFCEQIQFQEEKNQRTRFTKKTVHTTSFAINLPQNKFYEQKSTCYKFY